MTRSARLLLLTLAVFTALAGVARASTSASYAGEELTLTNNGTEAETFTVQIQDDSVLAYSYVVTSTVSTIGDPVGSSCTGGGTKTLTCTAHNIDQLILNMGAGGDTLTVTSEDDYSFGFFGGFTADGGPGNDTFNAGTETPLLDSLIGGTDDDTFNGSPTRADEFTAEPGNDTYHGGTRPAPPGGAGETFQVDVARDSWEPDGSDPVNVSLDGVANDGDGFGGTDNVGGDIESVEGTGGADTLIAGSGAVVFDGSSGNDVLTGGAGPDRLFGSSGEDTIRGGGGNDLLIDGYQDSPYRIEGNEPDAVDSDRLDGGAGEDRLVAGSGADDVAGGAGVDMLFYTRVAPQVVPAYPGSDFPTTFAPVTVSLDDQPNDGRTGAGDGANVHSDVEGVDTAEAFSVYSDVDVGVGAGEPAFAEDTIVGSGATNTFITGPGRDSVDPGGGADVVDAGTGDDTVTAEDRATDLISCGGGADSATADLPGTNPGRADVLSECETVTGTPLGLEGGSLPPAVTLPVTPKVVLAAPKVKLKTFLKRFTVALDVTTDQPATVAGELTTTRATISKVGALSIGSGTLASGTGKRTLKLKVAKKFRKKLKRKLRTKRQRRKGITLSAVVAVTNASDQAATATRTIKIKG